MNRFFKTADDQFIIKVIKGNAGPEEKEYFNKWLSQSDANKERYANLLMIWQKAEDYLVPAPPSAEEQFAGIWESINNSTREDTKNISETNTNSPKLFLTKAKDRKLQMPAFSQFIPQLSAAAIIIIASVSLFLLYDKSPKPEIQSLTPSVVNVTHVKYCEIKTKRAQRAEVKLPDGSVVYMNSESRLKFPKSFDSKERKIEFKGEGFFKIAKLNNLPFKIISGKTITEVVGTEFNIKTRSANKFSIVVVNGVVKTYDSSRTKPVIITKGEMLNYSAASGFSEPLKVKASDYCAWRKNMFIFSNTPLSEVMNELQLTFDTDYSFKNAENKNRLLTATFTTRSLDEILKAISLSLDINISINKNRIIVQ